MADPAWFQGVSIYQDAGNFTFSSPQEFTYASTQGQITAPTPVVAGSFWQFVVNEVSSNIAIGFVGADYDGPNIIDDYTTPGSCWTDIGGYVVTNGASAGNIGGWGSGAVITFFVTLDGANFACSQDGVNWNGGYTIDQILAGTGVIPTNLTGALVPFASMNDNASVTLYSSAANCTVALPSGGAYLLSNSVVFIDNIQAVINGTCIVVWNAINQPITGGLKYSIDGGAFTSGGGSDTGTSGVITLPANSDSYLHTMQLQDVANTLNTTGQVYFLDGQAGANLASGIDNWDSEGSVTGTVASLGHNVFYMTYVRKMPVDPPFGFYGEGTASVGDSSIESSAAFGIGLIVAGGGTDLLGYIYDESTGVSLTVVGGEQYSLSGTIDLSVSGTITYGGTLTTPSGSYNIGPVTEAYGGITGDALTNFLVQVSGTDGPSVDGYVISAIPVDETVLLSTATALAGSTLSLTGTTSGGPPSYLDISEDHGSTWNPAGTYETASGTTGAAFSATSADTLAIGTYPVLVRDSTTHVESNVVTVTVSSAETLVLGSAAGTYGGTLSLAGHTLDGTATALNVGVDGAYAAGVDYSTSGSNWTVSSEPVYSYGELDITVQDSTYPTVISNTVTLDIPEPSIHLSTATGTFGQTLSLTGYFTDGIPAGLNVSLDGTISAGTGYSVTGTNWVLSGPVISEIGELPVFVQDDINTGIESNTLTLDVLTPESITLVTASGTLNGILSIGIISNDGPPVALNLSSDGGATFTETTNYETTSTGTNDVGSADGFTLTAYGTYYLQAQDAENTTVVSNIYPFVLAASNTGTGTLGIPLYPTLGEFAGQTPTPSIIPLQNVAQQFAISLGGTTYNIRTFWNDQLGEWCFDLLDANSNPIVTGIPMVTGVDLLSQWQYLGIPGSIFILTNSDPLAAPTLSNLGTQALMFFCTYNDVIA